jgi:6-phosphofructokinase 1
MGRECGDIALYAGVAGGAECVLLPEFDTDLEAVCKKVTEGVTSGKLHNIIIKAEGVPIDSHELVHTLAERTDRDVKLVVLSYLQRGGSPTYRDRILATECGMKAIDLIRHGETGKAIGEVDGRIIAVDLDDALKAERGIDLDMYKAVDILSM